MKSIDIKSLLIGALFTAVVFLSTGWQLSSAFPNKLQVEITRFPSTDTLDVEFKRGNSLSFGSASNPIYVKQK
ncbi:MAG: hypothetical protein VYC62_04570 [Verrucomicrobiota bacterium]|jgi:hypothetical protein|nr:hypothetical protein [Verrucomicrobiota bacterium]